MIEWEDEAIILSARAHGENAAIVTVCAAGYGRCAGLVAGGQSARWHGVLQPGNAVRARWRARLSEHLGHFTFDLATTPAARWLDQPLMLAAIASACTVTEYALPERQPMPAIHAGLGALLAVEDAGLFGAAYVKWEMGVLAALGYGLDLSSCAATQAADDLIYVSPRSGRAVSREAGLPYHDKMLPLPGFLLGEPDWSEEEVWRGLQLTGHFLARLIFINAAPRLAPQLQEGLPPARQRLAALYRAASDSGTEEARVA
ncbi:MAG: DNA repair protein RecO [Alphaproteobacteria bacterium]